MSILLSPTTFRSLLVMIAVSVGLTLLLQGLVSAGAESTTPTVFAIAPGNAERVPFDPADGICTLAEAVEAANDQGQLIQRPVTTPLTSTTTICR
jgi:hypothetical protein